MLRFGKLIKLSILSASVLSISCLARPAKADGIFKLDNPNGGSSAVNLSSIINGTWSVDITGGSPSAGHIDVINDVGTITSFTIYYYGVTGTNAGSTIRCQDFNFAGSPTSCSLYDPVNGLTYADNVASPANLTMASYAITFDFGSPMSGDFDFVWSSLSATGDTGCIAGTPTCAPVPATPEPGGLILLGTALIVMATTGSRIAQSQLSSRFRLSAGS